MNIWTHFLGFLAAFATFLCLSYAKIIDDPLQLGRNASHLLSLVQNAELDAFDTGFIESQRAEFNVFMATMEQLIRADQIKSGEVE